MNAALSILLSCLIGSQLVINFFLGPLIVKLMLYLTERIRLLRDLNQQK